MHTAASAHVLDFEVYLLVTMKYGMINQDAEREAKLFEHGLSLGDAERIHQRVADALRDETTQFANLRALVGAEARNVGALSFKGILWPDFDFTANAGRGGSIQAAGYRRARGERCCAAAPTAQPPWSMDTADLAQCFGPTQITSTAALFAEYMPAQELHEFEWQGRRYGAGFGWGLFLSASLMWT